MIFHQTNNNKGDVNNGSYCVRCGQPVLFAGGCPSPVCYQCGDMLAGPKVPSGDPKLTEEIEIGVGEAAELLRAGMLESGPKIEGVKIGKVVYPVFTAANEGVDLDEPMTIRCYTVDSRVPIDPRFAQSMIDCHERATQELERYVQGDQGE